MSVRSINHEIATQIMLQLPDEKKATLEKAINRNFWLTSAAVLEIRKSNQSQFLANICRRVRKWNNKSLQGRLVHTIIWL